MKEGFCIHCKRNVSLTKGKFNWFFFLATMFIGIGEIYLLIWLFKKKKFCNICGCEIKR